MIHQIERSKLRKKGKKIQRKGRENGFKKINV